ncbi:targeting protein for XKLP2 [Artemisia annua]|uniref:Targeting protein for XKLP2 n=1 Tax=Artemisia annua TaxID=35608 RepID=A0A2U1L5N5_ARTAN|nr:targeting protein for XKLP2 [Artemisia annua]
MSTDNTRRNVQFKSLCDMNVAENSQKESEPSTSTAFLSTKKNFNLEPEKRRHTNLSNKITPSFAQENQEIQMQKLKGRKITQIASTGTRHSPHKARAGGMMLRKAKLMQTMPTEPAFKTSQSVCLGNIRSSAVQTPKFERRPLIRKSAEATTVVSVETTPRNYQRKPYLTTPKIALRTSLTARKPKIEIEQQEKVSNFKARPLNKKILESKGELGLFCNKKRQVTIPQEFHFATNKRIPPKTPDNAELFGKITSCLGSHKKNPIPRKTVPRPFHLQTEKRGERKESMLVAEIIHKHIQEEQPRIPASSPHPYTSDYHLVPSKTESRHCTKPEDEDASMRAVTAETILKEDSNAVPERVRRPLTEVQELSLHRTELDSKLKEKKMIEEIGLKQLKKSSVLHAGQVPSFEQPFSPQKSSKGVTKSMSPSSNVSVRKAGRRKIAVATATSSAASNMR